MGHTGHIVQKKFRTSYRPKKKLSEVLIHVLFSSLNDHLRTHNGEKPHECRHCDYRTARLTSLRNHEKTHTDERPYSCSLCEKCFRLKSHLDRHFLTHTNTRTFSCDVCSRTFIRSDSLQVVRSMDLKLPPPARINPTGPITSYLSFGVFQRFTIGLERGTHFKFDYNLLVYGSVTPLVGSRPFGGK